MEDSPDGGLYAFQVSRAKRLAQIICAVVYCFFSTGIVFGYAALKAVLIEECVYRDSCTDEELHMQVTVCKTQEMRMNLIFTSAAIILNAGSLPIGTLLDKRGPRITSIIGCVIFALGCVSLSLAGEFYRMPSFPVDGYVLGYLLIALATPFIYLPTFHLTNAFPNSSGMIMALLIGAFDCASSIFLFYRLAYEANPGTWTPRRFFAFYLIVPLSILIIQLTIMPKQSYKMITAAQKDGGLPESQQESGGSDVQLGVGEDESAALLNTRDAEHQKCKPKTKHDKSGIEGKLQGYSPIQQIMTGWWWLSAAFLVVQICRKNYFLATIRSQYTYMLGDPNKAVELNHFFDVALPLAGVCTIPLIGLLLDNFHAVTVLSMCVFTATLVGVLGIIPTVWAGYANICVFVVFRPFFKAALSDYAAKVFGFITFGRVYGTMMCLVGLSNVTQIAYDAITHKLMDDNPVPINVAQLIMVFIVGSSLVVYVWRNTRPSKKQQAWATPAISADEDLEENGISNYGAVQDERR